MISPDVERLISRYDDSDLAPAERAALAQALARDAEARGVLEQYRRLDAELERLPDGLDGVDLSGVRARVRVGIAAVEAHSATRRRVRRAWWAAGVVSAAAAVGMAVLAWQFVAGRGGRGGGPGALGWTKQVAVWEPSAGPAEARVRVICLAPWPAGETTEGPGGAGEVICSVGPSEAAEGSGPVMSSGGWGPLGAFLNGST